MCLRKRITGLIHGCATGADALAKEWQGIRIKRLNDACQLARSDRRRGVDLPKGTYINNDLWMVGCPAQWENFDTDPVVIRHRRDGKKYNAAAGMIRNKFMLTWKPDTVLALPGGRGTANMIELAIDAGVPVVDRHLEPITK